MDTNATLHFLYKIDCEPLFAKSPACGGPRSWQASEDAVVRYGEIFRERGMLPGLNFHTTPEAAVAHRDLFLELRREGCDIGLQLNVPGFRYPTYEHDLGLYGREEQLRILQEATADFSDTLGFAPESYTPCCGSKNRHTYPLLVSLGYRQTHAPAAGRYFPDRPDRCTIGCFPFPHWASATHQLVGGSLPLCVIPTTGQLTSVGVGRPFDLRSESPPTPETHERYRLVIDQSLEIQRLVGQPVKAICVGTHNTERANFENVEYVIDYTSEAAAREGLRVVPCAGPTVREALADADAACVEPDSEGE